MFLPRFLREAMHLDMQEVHNGSTFVFDDWLILFLFSADWLRLVGTISWRIPVEVDLCIKLFLCGETHGSFTHCVSSYIVQHL